MSTLDILLSLGDIGEIGEQAVVQALGVASMAVLGPAGPVLVNVLNNTRKTVRNVETIQKIVNNVQKNNGEYKPMTDKIGIKETKEVLFFVFSFTKAIQLSLQDGKFNWTDARYFIEPVKAIVDAVDNIDQVIPEVADISPEEMVELVAYIKENFDIEDDEVEFKIKSALDVGAELLGFVKKIEFK